MNNNTDWFRDAKWGLFIHFLAVPANKSDGSHVSISEWNKKVESFDVERFAEQLAKLKVKYVFITLGQNSGYFCSPNKTYDDLTNAGRSKCSRRDLVSDLYDALNPSGISLMVYLPSHAPMGDIDAVKALKCIPPWDFRAWSPLDMDRLKEYNAPDTRIAEFQRNWEAIIKEWSLRWGKKVKGWWIDGCYYSDHMYREKDAPNFKSFADAMKSGNPDSIVAFNPGIKIPVISLTEYEDYTAGEISRAFPVEDSYGPEIKRWINGAQYHILSFLGDGWGKGNPRFPDEFVIGFTKYVNKQQGVVSWDIPIENGIIPETFFRQLARLSENF